MICNRVIAAIKGGSGRGARAGAAQRHGFPHEGAFLSAATIQTAAKPPAAKPFVAQSPVAQSPVTKPPVTKPRGRKVRRTGAARWLHGLDVFFRAVAAIFGGYVAAALTTAVLARLLPGAVAEATIAATTFSFVIYVSVAIWAFADANAWRVWAGLVTFCGVLGGVLWLSLSLEPRL